MLARFLYISVLAPNESSSCIPVIVRKARQRNVELGLTGLLVFDGERFVQYLEGPRESIDTMHASLAADPRHVAFTPLLDEASPHAQRQFVGWSMAYADVMDLETLDCFTTLSGRAALEQFEALLGVLDMEP